MSRVERWTSSPSSNASICVTGAVARSRRRHKRGLALLCAAGILVALLHDDEHPRRRLALVLVAVGVVAVVCCVLAITGGVQHTLVNPLPSGLS